MKIQKILQKVKSVSKFSAQYFLEFLLCVDALDDFFKDVRKDEGELRKLFYKVSLIEINERGNIYFPQNLREQLENVENDYDQIRKAKITRLQFLYWFKDNITAMAQELDSDTVRDKYCEGIFFRDCSK